MIKLLFSSWEKMERLKPLESWIYCLTTWKMPVLTPQKREGTRRKTEKILDQAGRDVSADLLQ